MDELKKSYYKVPPYLSDGQHTTLIDNTPDLLVAIKAYCDEVFEGGYGTIKVQIVRMTESEY